ncbi:MAG: polymer-forming cytoskeletal protein [Candidatus Hydrogenedentota bacterium]
MLNGSRRKKHSQKGAGLTIIGQGTNVKGEIYSKGTVRIEGQVVGSVHCEGVLLVQDSGQVKADLVANHIVISGKVKGNLVARERLEVMPNATVIGDITAPRVSIAEGVVFEGQCIMKDGATPGVSELPAPEKTEETSATGSAPSPRKNEE